MFRVPPSCLLGLLGLLSTVRGNVMVYTEDLPHTIAEEFLDMPASFGPELPADGLRGLLVAGEPADGCGPLAKPPPATDNFTGKWLVLVARFNCSFEVKVRNAQAAGFDCAIVHNVNSSELETMSAKNGSGIEIPSVFVSELAGLMLAEEYAYPNRYYIMVNDDVPFNINTHLLLPFAIIVALCLVVILIFLLVKCINDRRRARRHRLPNRSLKKIPTCKFSKGDPYETCAICLDDYQEGERLRVLPCAHAYHSKCIDPWLTQNRRVCPVCKRRVRAAGERRAPRSDTDSDDTEPLVADPPPTTQGGTFDEQRENPFVRAARYIASLRGRQNNSEPDAEVAQPSEAHDETEENVSTRDTQPLIAPEPERRRRARRSRRARSAPRAGTEHSINATPASADGEIGTYRNVRSVSTRDTQPLIAPEPERRRRARRSRRARSAPRAGTEHSINATPASADGEIGTYRNVRSVSTRDTQPLIAPEPERRRRARRSRRARSAPRAGTEHSINATPASADGEIGTYRNVRSVSTRDTQPLIAPEPERRRRARRSRRARSAPRAGTEHSINATPASADGEIGTYRNVRSVSTRDTQPLIAPEPERRRRARRSRRARSAPRAGTEHSINATPASADGEIGTYRNVRSVSTRDTQPLIAPEPERRRRARRARSAPRAGTEHFINATPATADGEIGTYRNVRSVSTRDTQPLIAPEPERRRRARRSRRARSAPRAGTEHFINATPATADGEIGTYRNVRSVSTRDTQPLIAPEPERRRRARRSRRARSAPRAGTEHFINATPATADGEIGTYRNVRSVSTRDTQPLIAPEPERRRRARRSRRARSAPRAGTEHFINATPATADGEIGVAALPAPTNAAPRNTFA